MGKASVSSIMSAHVYQLGSHWTHFCEIWYWRLLL